MLGDAPQHIMDSLQDAAATDSLQDAAATPPPDARRGDGRSHRKADRCLVACCPRAIAPRPPLGWAVPVCWKRILLARAVRSLRPSGSNARDPGQAADSEETELPASRQAQRAEMVKQGAGGERDGRAIACNCHMRPMVLLNGYHEVDDQDGSTYWGVWKDGQAMKAREGGKEGGDQGVG